jgi:1,2-diacylglycerol 3-beta-galactosyltransferase
VKVQPDMKARKARAPRERSARAVGLPRVSILMTGAGGGHLASAQSLEEAFEGRARVTLLNILDEHARFPFNHVSDSYAPVVAIAPDLYRLAYDVVQTKVGLRLLESGAHALLRRDMADAIIRTGPDLVISVHALLNAVPLRAMREAGCLAPFISAVVDAGVPPVSWFDAHADLCCVADEGIRRLAIDAGMPPTHVVVTGLPIRRSFPEARGVAEVDARRALGVDPDLRLVLVMGGGAGMGRVGSMARALGRRLAQGDVRAQIAVVAGGNERLRRRLASAEWPVPVTVIGLTSEVAAWMSAADVLLTKAGPGTIAEAACLGVPTLLTGFVPGQEEENVAWAERNGGAVFEPHPKRAADLVGRWLESGCRDLEAMSARMRAMGRPGASTAVADAALALLGG